MVNERGAEIYDATALSSLCIRITNTSLWWPYVTLSPSDNTCDDVFFIAVRIPYYSVLCAFYGVYRRDSSARTLLRSNRHPIWHGTSRLLFHVSRLRQGKSALYDDTSDRSYSLSRGLQVDLGTCLSLFLRLLPWFLSLALLNDPHLAKLLKIDAL